MNEGTSSRKFGDYRVEKIVGSDGYRIIYKAYDEALDRPAALKVFSHRVAEHAEFVTQFKKNMRALAQLSHPRIPLVYYFGVQGKDYYVAMEWCEGGSLGNLLRSRGRMMLHEAVQILLHCIQGISAAWKLGIAHGNLRPNNIIFSEDGEIKIADFGLIPAELDAQSFSGALSFMAPELGNRQQSIDFRADIYSLGILLYYMLLNSLPESVANSDSAVESESPGSLPPEVLSVIDRMTREVAAERYDSYEELIKELEGLLRIAAPEESTLRVPKIRDLAPQPSITGSSFFDLLAALYQRRAEGVLKVNWLSLEKEFLVRSGEVVLFKSTQPDENIGRRFVENHWLSESEFERNRDQQEETMRRVLLSRAGTVQDVAAVYAELLKSVLWQIFHWPVFAGAFYPGKIENEPFASLRISNVLLEASRSQITMEEIRSRLNGDLLIKRTPQFEQLLAAFPLSPEESFLTFRLEDEDTKLSTLRLLTGLSEERVLRMTYLLEKIGALELRPVKVKTAAAARRKAPEPVVTRVPKEAAAPQPSPAAAAPAPTENQQPAPPRMVKGDEKKAVPVTAIAAQAAKFAEACFQKAEAAYEEKNYGMAAHHCREALRYRQDARFWHLLGSAYSWHPKFQKDAEDAFHQAISISEEPKYHAILAAFYIQRKLWLRARTHCQKALELDPDQRLAQELLVEVKEQKPGPGECWCVGLTLRK